MTDTEYKGRRDLINFTNLELYHTELSNWLEHRFGQQYIGGKRLCSMTIEGLLTCNLEMDGPADYSNDKNLLKILLKPVDTENDKVYIQWFVDSIVDDTGIRIPVKQQCANYPCTMMLEQKKIIDANGTEQMAYTLHWWINDSTDTTSEFVYTFMTEVTSTDPAYVNHMPHNSEEHLYWYSMAQIVDYIYKLFDVPIK